MAKELNINVSDLLYSQGVKGLQDFESSMMKSFTSSVEAIAVEAHTDLQRKAISRIKEKKVRDIYLKSIGYSKIDEGQGTTVYAISVSGEGYLWEEGGATIVKESDPTPDFLNDKPGRPASANTNYADAVATQQKRLKERLLAKKQAREKAKVDASAPITQAHGGYHFLEEVEQDVKIKLERLVSHTFSKYIR